MTQTINIHDIRKILPHRYPFLLIDRVIDYKVDEYLIAIKNVTMNEPFFPGHFPHYPVMPGVMILEAMAQSSAILAAKGLGADEADESTVYLFAGADRVKFKRQVEPGDQIRLEARIERKIRNVWKTSVVATVDDLICARAIITFTYQTL